MYEAEGEWIRYGVPRVYPRVHPPAPGSALAFLRTRRQAWLSRCLVPTFRDGQVVLQQQNRVSWQILPPSPLWGLKKTGQFLSRGSGVDYCFWWG